MQEAGWKPALRCGANWEMHPPGTGAILVARLHIFNGLDGMGAKYLPTIKDLKANLRFHQKQNPLKKFRKSVANQPAKKGGKR